MTEKVEPASRPRPRVFRMSPTAPEAAVPFAPAEAPLVEWQEDAFAREAERDGTSLPTGEAAVEVAQAQGMERREPPGLGRAVLVGPRADSFRSPSAFGFRG